MGHDTQTGRIKRIVADRGFGFLVDEQGAEFFFHRSGCEAFDQLRDGARVTFTVGSSLKGPRAENVTRELA